MKRRIKIKGWIAAVAAAAVLAAGCGVRTDTPVESGATAPEETTIAQTSGAEKPTHPEPSTIEPFPTEPPETETVAEKPAHATRVVLMTDMHYLAGSLRDEGEAFTTMVNHGDGKLVNYVEEIVDAALEEAISQNADVLILSGDLSLNGEEESHKELAKKLDKVEMAGIPVLVIPGNHDINNPKAAGYQGKDIYPANNTDPEEFAEIYGEFGYDEANSRDSNSLSYTYYLDQNTCLLMLDTCQYEPRNLVGGMIKTETYEWIEQQLDEAEEAGMRVLPVAHHNLLDESKVYVDDCTIEHSDRLIDLLEERNIPLFLSGHLHVQHFMQHDDIGIYEVVTSSLATPPCQYGVLDYMSDESFSYHTRQVDMERWAKRHHVTDENLLSFDTYSPPTLNKIFYNQAYDAMKDSKEEEKAGDLFVKLTPSEKQQMSQVYADINAACYAGKAVDVVEEAKERPAYKMWQEYCYPAVLFEYLEYIVEDAVKDYNVLEVD